MKTAKWVADVTVIDPNTLGDVEVSIFKHENGGMFGIDASFIDQVLEEGNERVPDPLCKGSIVQLIWE